jgi:hypothetical protein
MVTELISIVDCKLCAEIPTWQHVWEPPEVWNRLLTIGILEPGFGSTSGDREELRACPDCGTHYNWNQVYDPRFSEPGPPTTEWYLSRVTPHYARALLGRITSQGVPDSQASGDSFDPRSPTWIEALHRDLVRAPNLHIKKYIMDSLYEHYVFEGDWNGLRATLIDTADPGVRVYTAYRLFDANSDSVKALLSDDRAREELLVRVLAEGLSQKGEILVRFSTDYEPAAVSGFALHELRYGVPRQSLGPAIEELAAQLMKPGLALWWRERVRDLLIEYIGSSPERAKEVLDCIAGESEEAMAVRMHCQGALGLV